MASPHTSAEQILTTQQAARLLGISVSSVQQMVESGALDAWKTSGGHRRIAAASLQSFMERQASPEGRAAPCAPSVMVVEDHPIQLAMYRNMLDQWDLGLQARFCESGYKALIELTRTPPDILLTDIAMDGIDGFQLVRAVLDDPQLAGIQIAVLTALGAQELAQLGQLPDSVTVFHKPINGDELRGFLKAASAMVRQRNARRGEHGVPR